MRRLFERMQQYQFQKVREQPDKALTEDCRALQEEDIHRWVGGWVGGALHVRFMLAVTFVHLLVNIVYELTLCVTVAIMLGLGTQ